VFVDGSRFDGIARALAASGSRRRVLAGLAAGVLGIAGRNRAEAVACRTPGELCRGNPDCCSRACATDAAGRRVCQCRTQADCPSPANKCLAAACDDGACGTTPGVVCAALDQCHVPGTCNPATGVCSNPTAPDGTACAPIGGGSGTCRGGICACTPATCPGLGNNCGTVADGCGGTLDCGTCHSAFCSGNRFTSAQTCNASHVCAGGSQTTCQGATPVCNISLGCVQCNVNGDCPGASCSGNVYTYAQTCNASYACSGGSQVTCTGATPVCNSSLGCVQCNTAADCPATVSACGATTCADTVCKYPGSTVAPAELQIAGDCQVVVCDGAGGTKVEADPTDIPGPSVSACQINPHCIGIHQAYDAAAAGTRCTGADPYAHVCGDPAGINAGLCVECNVDADCLAISNSGTLACNTTTNPGICE
jgi:hypothetical protein